MNDSHELVKSATESNWIQTALFMIIGWLVIWGAWITRRSFSSLSRADHERICERRNTETDKKLAEIKDSVTELRELLIDVIRDK